MAAENTDGSKNDFQVDTVLETVNSLSLSECAKTESSKSYEDFKKKMSIDFNLKIEKIKYERDNCGVPEWPNNFECPFVWHLQDKRGIKPENAIRRSLRKLEELSVHNSSFTHKRYMALLKLVVEYYVTNQELECFDRMYELEALLMATKEEAKDDKDHPYIKIGRGLEHIVYATKAYLMMLHGRQEKARQILEGVTPVNLLSNDEQVFFNLRKARYFISFGYKTGKSVAIEFCNKALDLDPENADAQFLKAKLLRGLRRDVMFSTEKPIEEMKLLEKAYKNSGDAHKKVYLAQVYRDHADALKNSNRNSQGLVENDISKKVQELQSSALKLYKEALEENPDSHRVLRRVGYGIMNLPKSIIGPRGYKQALDCLKSALEKSESQMTLNVLGTYYSRYGNDKEEALKCFERSLELFQSDVALCDKVKIKFQLDPNYDPIPDLMSGLVLDVRKSKYVQILAQIGSYFLFIQRDFIKSLEAFSQAVNDLESLNHLKAFKVFYLRMYEPINLPEYLVNECNNFRLRNCNELSASGDEESNQRNLTNVQKLYDKIIKLEPDLAQIEVQPDLIDDLLKVSASNLISEKYKQQNGSKRYKWNHRETFSQDWRSKSKTNCESGMEKSASFGRSIKPSPNLNKGSPYHQERSRFGHTAAGYSGQDSFNNRGRGYNGYDQNKDRCWRNDQQTRRGCQNRVDQPVENWRQK